MVCRGGRTQTTVAIHTLLIELLRQARVLVRTHTQATYTPMYVGKTATATPWHNITMECAAVALMMLLNLSASTMYFSHSRCMATTIPREMAHLNHRLGLGNHGGR